MVMPGRSFNSGDYRYGFNGKEKDDEISGSGKTTTAEYWEYDSRLGRRWNIDPKPNYSFSPYLAFANNPLWFVDILGDTTYNFNSKTGEFIDMTDLGKKGQVGAFVSIEIVREEYITSDGSKSSFEKTERKTQSTFKFNDPQADGAAIRNGYILKAKLCQRR